MNERNHPFKVIIVGGSIAGLTLAHCLQRANIQHVVLEKSTELAPQIGASIGILPNGARILDQLGLYDDVESLTEPLNKAYISYPDGFRFSSEYPRVIKERFGFPIAFLDRQKLLEILYSSYPDKSNIHTNQRVVAIRQANHQVEVLTENGGSYTGDLAVGADGVHSKVRAEMWKLADELSPGLVSAKEKKSMTIEYACAFGISSAVPGLDAGNQVNAFYDGLTILSIHGKNGRIFWFVMKKLEKKYIYPESVRFSVEDATQFCQGLVSLRVLDNITFGHIWAKRESVSMTALEENVFRTWNYGRLACLGDSVHKLTPKWMTPNIGQGANTAIEDAAMLANLLHDALNHRGPRTLSCPELDNLLHEFKSLRYGRVKGIYQDSRFLVRFQARDGLIRTFFGRYYVPRAGDLPADMASKTIADGPMIKYVSLPKRSGPGWAAYSSKGRRFHPAVLVTFLLILVSCMLRWQGLTVDHLMSHLPMYIPVE